MKEEQKKAKYQLIALFWINLILFVCLTFYLLFQIGIKGRAETEQDFMYERFSIILTMLVIPLSLKLFHSGYKKITGEDLTLFLKKLKTYYVLRVLSIDAIIVVNLLGYYFIGSLNFLYMGVIALLAFAFCYPTESIVDPMVEEKKPVSEEDNDIEDFKE